jgi:hypothetical protein
MRVRPELVRSERPTMNKLPEQQELTAVMARRFAWFSIVVAVAAFVVWGATLYDVLVLDWVRAAVSAFCAVCLSITASLLARTAVRSIG